MKKTVSKALIIITIGLLLSGCYDRKEVDDLTYVIAIGLDKGKVEPLKMTLQYAVPKAMAGGGGGEGEGGGGGNKSIESITLETPSYNAGLNIANGFIGKEMNLSHAVVIVISEELAREDFGRYAYPIARSRQTRPNTYVAVSRCSAEDFLKKVKPIQEVDPTKYYQLILRSYKYTGFTADTSFFKFYTNMQQSAIQPIAVLAGVSKYKSSEEFKLDGSVKTRDNYPFPFEGDFKAGEMLKAGDPQSEMMGLAVFDGPKMVGEMTGEDSTDYLMVTGEFQSGYFTIPDPKVPDRFFVFNITQGRRPIRKVDISGNKPYIYVKLSLEADILAIQSGYNYENAENLPIAEDETSEFLKKEVTAFLQRTAKELKSDICGLGKDARKKFLTYQEWESYNWLSKYKNAEFDVDVDVKIRRPGDTIRSMPFKSIEGEVKR